MAKVAITESYLEDMADALREKTGLSTATFKPSEMANAISSISGGGITPTGTISITENGTHDVTTYASAYVSVSGGGGSEYVVTLSYNSVSQKWEPDQSFADIKTAYDAGKTVTVSLDWYDTGATADGFYFVDDGIEYLVYMVNQLNEGTLDCTVYVYDSNGVDVDETGTYYMPTGTKTITSSGTTDVAAYADAYVAAGTVTAPSTISGTSATVSTGTNTLTLSKTVSVTPNVTTAGYITSGTAGNATVSLTGNVTTKGATTYTPGTTNQTIASGTYLTGAQTISGDANLIAGNIKKDVTIFGTTGTYEGSGGGGSSNFTLLGTLSLGTISTSSTSATDTGKSITVKGIYDYDLLVCECSVDSITNNRHAATTRLCWLTASSDVETKNGATFATATWNCKLSSAGVATTRSGTTAYGIYANGCTVSAGSTGDNGQAVITIYQRYNSTSTGTINGSYTMRVYGVKIYDLIGG